MRKGRPPHVTLQEAEIIAWRRGSVIPVPGSRSDAFDLIICEKFRVVFVRVRRTLTRFTWPLEVLAQYQYDIARVHRLPLTDITSREFWLRLPNGRWQFFLVRHDSIIEIGADGLHRPRSELPIVTAEFTEDEPSSSEGLK
jgi:hypothetical protein